MFDYIGKKWFLGLALFIAIDLIWFAWVGYSFHLGPLLRTLIKIVALSWLMFAFHALYQRCSTNAGTFWSDEAAYTYDMLAKFAEALLFFVLGWVGLRIFNHLSMATTLPYADPWLASWDTYLFPFWNEYFRWVSEQKVVMFLLDMCYSGLTPISFFAFSILFFMGRQTQARFFVLVFSTSAIVFTTIGMFFPAKAAVVTLLNDPEVLKAYYSKPGTYSVEIIHALKTRTDIVFNLDYLPGLTTFPSFHTGAGIILLYAMRRTFLFFPCLVYVSIMIASTPVFGGHYFIDVVAGALLALAICMAFARRTEFDGLFAKPQKQPVTNLAGGTIAISAEGV